MTTTGTATIIKILMAVLLGICLLKMPYAYYQYTRIAVFAGFIYLAYSYAQCRVIYLVIPSVGLAILFNPILKIMLHKKQWQEIDFILAIGLVLWSCVELVLRFRNFSNSTE